MSMAWQSTVTDESAAFVFRVGIFEKICDHVLEYKTCVSVACLVVLSYSIRLVVLS